MSWSSHHLWSMTEVLALNLSTETSSQTAFLYISHNLLLPPSDYHFTLLLFPPISALPTRTILYVDIVLESYKNPFNQTQYYPWLDYIVKPKAKCKINRRKIFFFYSIWLQKIKTKLQYLITNQMLENLKCDSDKRWINLFYLRNSH